MYFYLPWFCTPVFAWPTFEFLPVPVACSPWLPCFSDAPRTLGNERASGAPSDPDFPRLFFLCRPILSLLDAFVVVCWPLMLVVIVVVVVVVVAVGRWAGKWWWWWSINSPDLKAPSSSWKALSKAFSEKFISIVIHCRAYIITSFFIYSMEGVTNRLSVKAFLLWNSEFLSTTAEVFRSTQILAGNGLFLRCTRLKIQGAAQIFCQYQIP